MKPVISDEFLAVLRRYALQNLLALCWHRQQTKRVIFELYHLHSLINIAEVERNQTVSYIPRVK